MLSNSSFETDFLVIGGGIAGSLLALKLSKIGKVTVICKEKLCESNSSYAQGGIASVLLNDDSFESHVQDTLKAGAGLCHETVVRKVVAAGPHIIQELIDFGVHFTEDAAGDPHFHLHLTREGGHSARRVIHAADLTGQAIQKQLEKHIRQSDSITILEFHMAIDLLTSDKIRPEFSHNRCFGAYVLDTQSQEIKTIQAKGTFLCTGGLGKIYQYTTNPDIATGDGIALAWRAGARIANLEFVQFHPTCLYHPLSTRFLISEALRGEGAILKSRSGERFMEGVDDRLELAPRDVVARAIDAEIKRTGEPFVYLDISHKPADFIKSHFPNIYKTCLELGIDMTTDPIPVVPAAHYSCGGVVTDTRGRTGIEGLWAIGEVACTGLHGANRLASNSLLEGATFAEFAFQDAKNIFASLSLAHPDFVPSWELGNAVEPDEAVVVSQLWDEIRRTMWNYVGIVRTDRRLERAHFRIRQIVDEIEHYYWNAIPSRNILEVRNLAQVAMLTVRCARARKESRGIHYSLDYPTSNDLVQLKDTVLT